MESVDDNSLTQVTEEPITEDALLDLIYTNKEELISKTKVRGSIASSDLEMVEIRILRERNKKKKKRNKITTLDLRRAELGLLRQLLGRISWGYSSGEESRRG